ncbi:MAG: phosphate signaling complex protein PhoU [Deltaproteobacteria bacterium]|nr:phosphate signaling complex protein PhoU [Deltaproteobacteria bacterium]
MLEGSLKMVKEMLVQSAALVEKMIEKSIDGLTNKDVSLLSEVIEQDEPKENALELEIDEACIHWVACYQPHARHLRTIMMILRMNNDLERIADEAVNICESALIVVEAPEVKPLVDIPTMAEKAMGMLRDSLRSLLEENADLGRKVCKQDDQVDELRDQVIRELVPIMKSRPEAVEASIHLIRIARSLERIGDLSTNICEDVVYMVEGATIKHHQWRDCR